MKALELDPGGDGGGALSNIAVLDSEVLGRHDDAIVSARRLLQIRPVRPGTIYHVAWPLLFLRDDATTDRWLTEGLNQIPDNPRLQYLKAALRYLQGDEAAALALARKIVEDRPAFEEGLMVAAELAYLTAAPDAEAQIERLFRRLPGLETGPLLKQESYQTSYAYLLMARGERSRAATLLGEALTRAHQALENGNENQRVPFEIAAIHATQRRERSGARLARQGVRRGLQGLLDARPAPDLRGGPDRSAVSERAEADGAGGRTDARAIGDAGRAQDDALS